MENYKLMQTFYSHIHKNKKGAFLFKFIFIIGFVVIGYILSEVITKFVTIYLSACAPEKFSNFNPLPIKIIGFIIVFVICFGSYLWQRKIIEKGIDYIFTSMGHNKLQLIYDNLLKERDDMTFFLTDTEYDRFRKITPESCRALSHVVEEIAIAANIKRPEIYIDLTNPLINACTLGLNKNNAGISVTYGALTKLSRDEIQAVVAHEFSHICNGDTETNLKSVAAVCAMSIISDIGSMMVNVGTKTKVVQDTINIGSDNKNNNSGVGLFVSLGVCIMILGSIGALFSELMKRTISRRSEYLADANAVKYTRNPLAMVSALLKIGTEIKSLPYGSSPYSHMYFCSAFKEIMDSHPSLKSRIQALETMVSSGDVQEIAKKIYIQSQQKQPFFNKINDDNVVNHMASKDVVELNKAIVAATVVAQTCNLNLVPSNSEDNGLDSSHFTNLAQAVSALIRVTAKEGNTINKLAHTSPTNFRRELNRGIYETTNESTIFNIINKCRAFYKLSPELIQTQARTLIKNLMTEEPTNIAAASFCILFTTGTVSSDHKFDQPVFNAMVPRLFGFLGTNAISLEEPEFTNVYTECLNACGVPFTKYQPFPLAKLNMVLSTFCELDLEHFRKVTDAIDNIFAQEGRKNFAVITLRALFEAHCENQDKTQYAIDETEAVIIQDQMRSISQIMEDTGVKKATNSNLEKEQKRVYNNFLTLMALLVKEPDNLVSLSNIFDINRINAIIFELKNPSPNSKFNISENDFKDLLRSFRMDYGHADIVLKRGMSIAFNRLFNSEPSNSMLAYFSLVMDIREILNSDYIMPENTFAEHCGQLYCYLATNSTPNAKSSQQDFVNEACIRANINPIPFTECQIKYVFTDLLDLKNATKEQKVRFKLGFDYLIKADNEVTDDERFLNYIIETILL